MTAPTPAQTQRQHDTPADLVTEEMVDAAMRAIRRYVFMDGDRRIIAEEALRAVAPMIAARLIEKHSDTYSALRDARAAEREGCARACDAIAAQLREDGCEQEVWTAHDCATHIRARGEKNGSN
jgi:hypothetical protein